MRCTVGYHVTNAKHGQRRGKQTRDRANQSACPEQGIAARLTPGPLHLADVERDEQTHPEQCRRRIDVARGCREAEEHQEGECGRKRKSPGRARRALQPQLLARMPGGSSRERGPWQEVDRQLEEILADGVGMSRAVAICGRGRHMSEPTREVVPEENAQRFGAMHRMRDGKNPRAYDDRLQEKACMELRAP